MMAVSLPMASAFVNLSAAVVNSSAAAVISSLSRNLTHEGALTERDLSTTLEMTVRFQVLFMTSTS